MGKAEKLTKKEKSLYDSLLEIRKVGNKNLGHDRTLLLSPLLNKIMGENCEWEDSQCALFLKNFIEKYVDLDKQDVLLMSFGLIEPYTMINPLSKRLLHYYEAVIAKKEEILFDSFRRNAREYTKEMALKMYQAYRTKPNELYNLVSSLCDKSQEGVKSRQLSGDLLQCQGEGANANTAIRPEAALSFQSLKRNYKISNIILSEDSYFVGGFTHLQEINKRFEDGRKIQIIGGASGTGKTRLALEFAKTHAEDYQIICWIDACNGIHITSSVLNFFDHADVLTYDKLLDNLPQIFCAFFEQNTDWLIIFNDADLIHSKQYEILKQYIPNGNGKILITSNFCGQLAGTKLYLLDGSTTQKNYHNDIKQFYKRKLGLETLDESDLELITRLGDDMTALTLITSYIKNSDWIDSSIYLHMLDDRGAKTKGSNILNIAFDLLMEDLHIKQKYFNDPVSLAVEKFLLICASLKYHYVEFNLLANTFSVLPETIIRVCEDEGTKKRFYDKLMMFGVYEICDGRMIIGTKIREAASYFFDPASGWGILDEYCSNIEKIILKVENNQFVEDKGVVLSHLRPYSDFLYPYLLIFGQEPEGNAIKDKYPNIYKLSSDQ